MTEKGHGEAVSLGCGTLILIALIVLFLGNRGQDELEREIRRLRSEVADLRKAVEEQTDLIKGLRSQTEEPPPGADVPGGPAPQ